MVVRVRDQDLLERELAAIAAELRDERDARYADRLQGALRGIEWLLGRHAVAPVSARSIERPPASDAYSEALWADEVATGMRPTPQGLTRDHAGGIASGLSWALGRSNEAPSPLGENAPMRSPSDIEQEYEANLPLAKDPPPQWTAQDVEEQLGVLSALAWLLGRKASPISGRRAPLRTSTGGGETTSAVREVVDEELEAAARLTGLNAPATRLSKQFAGGYYDALAWALELTDRDPGPM